MCDCVSTVSLFDFRPSTVHDIGLSEARRTEDPEFEDSIQALWDKVPPYLVIQHGWIWLGNPPKHGEVY